MMVASNTNILVSLSVIFSLLCLYGNAAESKLSIGDVTDVSSPDKSFRRVVMNDPSDRDWEGISIPETVTCLNVNNVPENQASYEERVTNEALEKFLPKYRNLKTLYLRTPMATEKIIPLIVQMESLETLVLQSMNIEDGALVELEKLKNLKTLLCISTKVTAEGIRKLKQSNANLHTEIKEGGMYFGANEYPTGLFLEKFLRVKFPRSNNE